MRVMMLGVWLNAMIKYGTIAAICARDDAMHMT